jgi:transposase
LRSTASARDALAGADLSPVGRQAVDTALEAMDRLRAQQKPVAVELGRLSRTLLGPRTLTQHWGIGPITAPIIWAELGDTRRFGSSQQAVRYTGLDVTVHSSGGRRAPGHLSRQGPPALRWALVEAAQHASKVSSPDHDYYRQVRARIDHGRAALAVARKLTRRIHHILAALGDAAWEPPATTTVSRSAA